MLTFSSLLILTTAIIEPMAGLLGNGTILVISSTSCLRSKILSSYDMIMICLSLSRFFFSDLDDVGFVPKPVFFFYCTKVVSFTQSLFICVHINFTAPLTMTNSSERRVTMKASLFGLILFCNAGIALPLIVFVVSSILLIRSLWIHTRHMQNIATSFPSLYSTLHILFIWFILFYFILFYFILFYFILFYFILPLSTGEAMSVAVMADYPEGHSMVLIWSNPKFQELPAKILHHTNCHARTRSV
uniref:Taste receptor type 2 member 40 n=1 Tax=Athene cunicularia TaxID=194338 RepID=A0A663M6N6_ATHCN